MFGDYSWETKLKLTNANCCLRCCLDGYCLKSARSSVAFERITLCLGAGSYGRNITVTKILHSPRAKYSFTEKKKSCCVGWLFKKCVQLNWRLFQKTLWLSVGRELVMLSKTLNDQHAVQYFYKNCQIKWSWPKFRLIEWCTYQHPFQRGRGESEEPSGITTFIIALPGTLLGLHNFCENIGMPVIRDQ